MGFFLIFAKIGAPEDGSWRLEVHRPLVNQAWHSLTSEAAFVHFQVQSRMIRQEPCGARP